MKRKQFVALILTAAMAGAVALGCAACAADDSTPARGTPGEKTNTVKIHIKVENKTPTATLDDNATSKDFVALLPVSLTLRDFAAAEGISELPRKLSIEARPQAPIPT